MVNNRQKAFFKIISQRNSWQFVNSMQKGSFQQRFTEKFKEIYEITEKRCRRCLNIIE